jgi:hypothetical protein
MAEQLEARLERLGAELDFPETPDVVAVVAERLRAPGGAAPVSGRSAPRGRRALSIQWRALVLALVALLILAGGVVAAVPDARNAVLEFFGLRGATVERRTELPPAPPPRPLDLGEHVTLKEARDRVDFRPLIPAGLPPGRAYVRSAVPGGELSLAYPPTGGLREAKSTGLGLLATEFRGDLAPELIGKMTGQATKVERLSLDGSRAIWIEGAPHFFFYRDPQGEFHDNELRLAANVLLVQRGRMLVRLEGAFDRAKAIELYRSLR